MTIRQQHQQQTHTGSQRDESQELVLSMGVLSAPPQLWPEVGLRLPELHHFAVQGER